MVNNFGPDKQDTDKEIAKLALFGEAISLFGQAITTLAAYLTLEAAEDDSPGIDDHLSDMQKQIDFLLAEMDRMKQ